MDNTTETMTTKAAELEALVLQYREMKHSINNSFGVIMALAELVVRRPELVEKLSSVILERAPEMVKEMQAFDKNLRAFAEEVKS